MKKFLQVLLVCMLAVSMASPAFAASKKTTKVKPNTYTMPKEGTVLQDQADRNISINTPAERHPIIPGESPTTGLSWNGIYLPMLVQFSNPYPDRAPVAAGTGVNAPWGAQYADIIYEGILYRQGATRITFLFSDSFAENQPTSTGPVRSARIGHVLLREEWQGGIVYAGGPRAEENNISQMFAELGASEKGVLFNLLDGKWEEYKTRLTKPNGFPKAPKAPDNYSANVVGLRSLIPAEFTSEPHAFLFADSSPYVDGYEFAYSINLDWGDKRYISHFYYDEMENVYLRYSCDVPFVTFPDAEAAGNGDYSNQIQLSFSNVIIQRVPYEYTNNNKTMPVMQSVGKGNADIFIGGRYIPGYWVRESIEGPTVYYDDHGDEIQLTRGKTFIAHLPPESLCTFGGVE